MSFLSQLTGPADLEMLASSTQILTSNPEELTAENVTTAAQIANTLLLSPNATEVQTVNESEEEQTVLLKLSLKCAVDGQDQATTTIQ